MVRLRFDGGGLDTAVRGYRHFQSRRKRDIEHSAPDIELSAPGGCPAQAAAADIGRSAARFAYDMRREMAMAAIATIAMLRIHQRICL